MTAVLSRIPSLRTTGGIYVIKKRVRGVQCTPLTLFLMTHNVDLGRVVHAATICGNLVSRYFPDRVQ